MRHTVGLGDALAPGDLRPKNRVDDGLPQDLEASIRAYGLRYFKVKLSGVSERDLPRLGQLARRARSRNRRRNYFVTLDGNENFEDFGAFREFWERAASEPALQELWRRIVVVEQPVHRDRALGDDAGDGAARVAGSVRRSSSTNRTVRSATCRAHSNSAMREPVTRTAKAS